VLSPYQKILNEMLFGGKQTTFASFFKKPVMGKEPNDPQP
jgi:hypothetical protein